MSLPIVILFESHWDTTPKYIIKDLLPDLSDRGYDTFCFEAPQDLPSTEIIARHNASLKKDSELLEVAEIYLAQNGITDNLSKINFSHLSELMKLYVSSQKYFYVAERIKQLPSSKILKEIFDDSAKISISLKGIDINKDELDEMTSVDICNRMEGIRRKEDQRIRTMFQNLFELKATHKRGIIFACGSLHAEGLIAEFKKRGMQDEVLYYFPYSSIESEACYNDTLKDHSQFLTQSEIKPFCQRVLKDITGKTRYIREIRDYNSHAQFLTERFKTHFKAYLRPGLHVDALTDIDAAPDIEDIERRVSDLNIQTHRTTLEGRNYLVISNVNTKEIADQIRKL